VVSRSRIRIPDDHFSTLLAIAECGILGDSSSYSHRPSFMTLGEMTDVDKITNPQHFGSDPVDIRIRIRINPEIWIRIPDHFWLRLDALAKVCALWAQSIVLIDGVNFCRAMLRKRGLCRHVVSVCACPSVTFVDSVKTSIRIFKLFSPSLAKPF